MLLVAKVNQVADLQQVVYLIFKKRRIYGVNLRKDLTVCFLKSKYTTSV